jgi:hypothetical protein
LDVVDEKINTTKEMTVKSISTFLSALSKEFQSHRLLNLVFVLCEHQLEVPSQQIKPNCHPFIEHQMFMAR